MEQDKHSVEKIVIEDFLFLPLNSANPQASFEVMELMELLILENFSYSSSIVIKNIKSSIGSDRPSLLGGVLSLFTCIKPFPPDQVFNELH